MLGSEELEEVLSAVGELLEVQNEHAGIVVVGGASLGASAVRGRGERAASIIDPEALLLFSLYVEPAERRLLDFARWWAGVGSELLSVQRTKTLLKRFPPEAGERLGRSPAVP